MPKSKPSEKKEAASDEKKQVAMPEKKEMVPARARRRTTALAPYRPPDLWRDFDRVFQRFRTDFEDLLLPSRWPFAREFPMMPMVETRVPRMDLEDRGKDFLLTTEMPGFKKEDIDIHVQENSVEIKGTVGCKYDDKTKKYVCKERACESFYRMIELPEEIKTDAVEANLKDGVMEIILPKKAPRQKKKITVK